MFSLKNRDERLFTLFIYPYTINTIVQTVYMHMVWQKVVLWKNTFICGKLTLLKISKNEIFTFLVMKSNRTKFP